MAKMTPARRNPRPLDAERLNELALGYVARFATSAAKLELYLRRKLRERGWAQEGEGGAEPPVRAVVERMVALGFVDDESFARAKSGSLLRRGYGLRRVEQALDHAGIAAPLREEVRADPAAQRRAALAMARKRRIGPFGKGVAEPKERERQVAAMLRAGHPLDSARNLVDAATIVAAEDWAAELDEEC